MKKSQVKSHKSSLKKIELRHAHVIVIKLCFNKSPCYSQKMQQEYQIKWNNWSNVFQSALSKVPKKLDVFYEIIYYFLILVLSATKVFGCNFSD